MVCIKCKKDLFSIEFREQKKISLMIKISLPKIENLFKTLDENKQAVKAVGPVLLLRCNSETTANNIASAPQLSKWCQRVGKDQLIIPENKESQFRALIHELSYAMPTD